MEPLIIVSGDGHVSAPAETYREYLDPKYRSWMADLRDDEKALMQLSSLFGAFEDPERLAVVDDRNRIRLGGINASWDPELRLRELDAEGIAAEVLFPGSQLGIPPFIHGFNRPYPADVRMAGVRAYHRWLADLIAPSRGRLIGTAEAGPVLSMDETLEELRFVAERGFRGVFVPGFVPEPDVPPVYAPYFEPFWSTCSDLGLVLTLHIGHGSRQGEFTEMLAGIQKLQERQAARGEKALGFEDAFHELMTAKATEENPDSKSSRDLTPIQPLWQLIFSGVFDRYPDLKLAVCECRGDWVPRLKAHLDRRFLAADKRPKNKLKPSEYFGRNIFITPSSPRRQEVELRHEIGLDNFLFGADYPHPEGTWPNTLVWLRAVFQDVPENELRAILGENAIRVYGLDKHWLAGIAAKIGPAASDVIGRYAIDDRMVRDFDMRSGFSSKKPNYDQQLMERQADRDLLRVTTTA